MGFKTNISWTHHTFNIAWGCVKVSPGCKNCYAERDSTRYGKDVWGPSKPRLTFGEKHWNEPAKWNRLARQSDEGRRRVFCSSMCDIGEDHPTIAAELRKLWPLTIRTPWLDWLLLTKRSERLPDILPPDWDVDVYDNVWLGVSVENNDYVGRLDDLRKVEARVRWVSYEPALGPIPDADLTGIDWLVYGGESGPNYRSDDDQWARDALNLCNTYGTKFFFKQTAAPKPGTRQTLDGKTYHNYPLPILA